MGIQERKKREREMRKSAILNAARLLLRERGFNRTTTKEIAKKCELSEATLFFYFKNKQEIFTSLLFEGINLWNRRLKQIAALDLSASKKLTQLWEFNQEVYAEHPEYYYVSAHLARPQSMVDISDGVREEIISCTGENFQRIADMFNDILGVENGHVAADLFWASCLGLILLWDARANLGIETRLNEDNQSKIFDLLSRGLLAPPPKRESS